MRGRFALEHGLARIGPYEHHLVRLRRHSRTLAQATLGVPEAEQLLPTQPIGAVWFDAGPR
jgi:hypothetical protein